MQPKKTRSCIIVCIHISARFASLQYIRGTANINLHERAQGDSHHHTYAHQYTPADRHAQAHENA